MWVLQLAERLGWANPDAMLATMGPSHVAEWMAFDRLRRAPAEVPPQTASEARSVLDGLVKRHKK